MRRLAVLLMLSSIACSSLMGGVPLHRMTPEDWRADLAYLSTQLPKRHVNLYRTVTREQFARAVEDLDARIPSLSTAEIEVGLTRIVAMAGDGHTELWLARPGTGMHYYPVLLRYFGEDLRVIASGPDNARLVGARILSFDETPAAEAFERVKPLLAHDNDMEFVYAAPLYLVLPEVLHALGIANRGDTVTLALDRDGEKLSATLKPVTRQEYEGLEWKDASEEAGVATPLYLRRLQDNYWYEWLPESKTLFLKYNRCENQHGGPSIKSFARDLFDFVDRHPVERFVIDLRQNPGGNYELNPPLIDGIKERSSINRKGHLFALIGRRTFSAATVAAIDLRSTTEAILLGERSRGRPNGTDNMETMTLPRSGLRVDYTERVKDHAPALGDAPYLPLDREVEITFDDFRNGRDPVLDAAMGYVP